MPHAITAPAGRALVPAEIEYGNQTYYGAGEVPFRFNLTNSGKQHPVTQQSSGGIPNERMWASFPILNWRHPVSGIKEGAEVLLTAKTEADQAGVASEDSLATALQGVAKRRELEAKTALVVTRQTGKGKVALLLTDRTWRLREGAGDLYHHRFWGNLVRWGAGPILRSGGTHARLGTDQLSYTPDDRPKITARLQAKDSLPVADDSLRAEVLRDGQILANVKMTAVAGSNGIYEARLDSFKQAGKYEVRLRGDSADDLIKDDGTTELKTGFRVTGSTGPQEISETTLNLPLLETIAQLSGGKVVSPDKTAELGDLFLTEINQREEIRESALWDSGWLMALMVILLGSEWITRRTSGLP